MPQEDVDYGVLSMEYRHRAHDEDGQSVCVWHVTTEKHPATGRSFVVTVLYAPTMEDALYKAETWFPGYAFQPDELCPSSKAIGFRK